MIGIRRGVLRGLTPPAPCGTVCGTEPRQEKGDNRRRLWELRQTERNADVRSLGNEVEAAPVPGDTREHASSPRIDSQSSKKRLETTRA